MGITELAGALREGVQKAALEIQALEQKLEAEFPELRQRLQELSAVVTHAERLAAEQVPATPVPVAGTGTVSDPPPGTPAPAAEPEGEPETADPEPAPAGGEAAAS